jgi:hypothetical protein
MDPNAALRNLQEMVAAILDNADWDTSSQLIEFAEGFTNLDAWLSNGGSLPASWAQ